MRNQKTMRVITVKGVEVGRIIAYFNAETGEYVGSAFMSARRVRRGDCVNFGMRFN